MTAEIPPAPDQNRQKLQELERLGWYHSIELPDGRVIPGFQTIEQLRARLAQFRIPEDLRGKRVLDIGTWDGWFSFEMERRGAEVVAIDSTEHERFRVAHELLGSKVEYRIENVCRLSPEKIGYFDIVLFLGVLYHLKHPMLALEKVCELSTDLVAVESFVIDDGSDLSAEPVMKFYEATELCGQFDNWVGPNTACLLAMCRSAGFASVDLQSVIDHRAHVTCKRRWPEPIATRERPSHQPPYLTAVENAATHGRKFSSADDDYVAMWFKSSRPDLTPADVFPRIGPYGSHPVFVRSTGVDGWQVNCKLPPGLASGWHEATLRTSNSGWGNAVRIGVDLLLANSVDAPRTANPTEAREIHIAIVTDGQTWERNLVHTGIGGCISLWVSGMPEDAAKEAVNVRLGANDLPTAFLSEADPEGLRQINAMLPPEAEPGDYPVAVSFADRTSDSVPVKLV
jgi:tRNA (mo5U34)-methyltransferase